MTKTISQKLRELAYKHRASTWSAEDHRICSEVLLEWRPRFNECLDDLTPDEWFLFCNLVACALESEQ
jgi:hypothetical protein